MFTNELFITKVSFKVSVNTAVCIFEQVLWTSVGSRGGDGFTNVPALSECFFWPCWYSFSTSTTNFWSCCKRQHFIFIFFF